MKRAHSAGVWVLFWLASLGLLGSFGCADATSSNGKDTAVEVEDSTNQDIADQDAPEDLLEVDEDLAVDVDRDVHLDEGDLIDDEADQQAQALPDYLTQEGESEEPESGWESVERWRDGREIFAQEDYLEDGRNDQSGQAEEVFETAQPPASDFLLHTAPGWDSATRPVPVLLVHGAGSNADHAWSDPSLLGFCGAVFCPDTGLMQHLVEQGFAVFAISFPHMHGDNQNQATHIGDALAIIRHRMGVEKVDIVAWSKGGFAARLYAGSLALEGDQPYRDDVRRLILLATPNKGLDYAFRHGISQSVSVYPACGVIANTAAVHSDLMCYGLWYSHPELTLFVTEEGDFFPGQRQMLYRWDHEYEVDLLQQDYHTTYYGGAGFVSESLGIDAAIAQGSLVEPLLASATPETLEVFQLCGGATTIPYVLNESTGDSDGLLFLASCQATEGLTQVSEQLLFEDLNHFELGWEETAMAQVSLWLGSE